MFKEQFCLIAGPCVLEGDDVNVTVAQALVALGADLDLRVIFKASFDKANRSRHDAPRGPGLDEGLKRLAAVKEQTGLPLLTDVHEASQARRAAEVVDVLQIPAFLCRQTDLLVAAGATGKVVNIKKGQWMAPEEMARAVEKAQRAGASEVTVTERGSTFGYGDLVVDMRSFLRLRDATGVPAIFDGTHSVQQPGLGEGGTSGGQPQFIGALVRAATAAGCDGLFLEVHPDPPSAPSDGTNMLRLDELRPLVQEVLAIRRAMVSHPS